MGWTSRARISACLRTSRTVSVTGMVGQRCCAAPAVPTTPCPRQACITSTTRWTRMHCMYHSCLSLSPRSLPRVCVRRQATLPSVRSRRQTLVHPSFTLRTVRI
jgi:hypothetical protein